MTAVKENPVNKRCRGILVKLNRFCSRPVQLPYKEEKSNHIPINADDVFHFCYLHVFGVLPFCNYIIPYPIEFVKTFLKVFQKNFHSLDETDSIE